MKLLFPNWRKLGFRFLRLGTEIIKPLLQQNQEWLLKSVIKDTELCISKSISTITVSAEDIERAAESQIQGSFVWCWDSKYRCLKKEDFESIKTADFADRMKWIADIFDCDNFASLFSDILTIIFGVNSIGIAIGAVLDKQTKEVLGYHAYNILPLIEKDKIVLYLYEPQTDETTIASRETNMSYGIYRTDLIIFK